MRRLPLLTLLVVLAGCSFVRAQSAFRMNVVERSTTVDSSFATEAPFLISRGAISVVCPWSLDETSNGGNTASGGYAWNVGGPLTGCGAIVKNYLSQANGGSCTGNDCPIINITFPVIQSPSANGNTFTPTYVFSSTYAGTLPGPPGPQDAIECNTAGGAYKGDSTYLNSVTNVNSTPIANVAKGLPVPSELPYMTALQAFIAAAKAHYASFLGNQLGYMRFGSLGPNEELHDFCSAQLITATGVGNLAGLKTLWMNTLGTFKAFETAASPTTVPLQTAINTEQGGDTSWLTAEAGVAAGTYGEGLAFNGVVGSDLTPTTAWVTTFALYPNVPHELQTVTQSATDGTGTTGTLTTILPFILAHVSTTAPTYYEPFPGDAACILAQPYTDANGCSNSGTFYSQYPALANLFFPANNATLGCGQSCVSGTFSIGSTCGPPTYICSVTALAAIPPTVISVGGTVGAGTVVTPTDFKNPIERITDIAFNPTKLCSGNKCSFNVGNGGSGDTTAWNSDSSLLVYTDIGGSNYPCAFTFGSPCTWLYSTGGANGITFTGASNFAHTNSQVIYVTGDTTGGLSKSALVSYNFTNRSVQASPTTLFEFKNCFDIGAGFSVAYTGDAGHDLNDNRFALDLSNSGGQGASGDHYANVWDKGANSCYTWDTQSGQVFGPSGLIGTITLPVADRFTIHNSKMSKDGTYLYVQPANCGTGCTDRNGLPYAWQIGTTTVLPIGAFPCGGGHWTEGRSHFVNGSGCPAMGATTMWAYGAFSTPININSLAQLPPITPPLDQHNGWENVDANDTYPIFATSTSYPTNPPVFNFGFVNEVLGTSPVTGVTWRFAHTHSIVSAVGGNEFSGNQAIGSISQDGRYYAWSSNWDATLGDQSGNPTCSTGTTVSPASAVCRVDVFVVKLQ